MEGHSARVPADLAHRSASHRTNILNQQQLQTARAALWHQTAPLETADEATRWLEELGLCLFLPRHAQLPAPAPSLVEAVHGGASAAPPAAALQRAAELAAGLVDERRAVPLNLLGTFSEQPDFLITPEVLPWVAAIRGDRQWNAAPGGRTAPLVVRTWQVLDREGEATAVELRELLGRELTEAAVLRALTELWTTVRAMPVARRGEPTRWTLLKNRFPAQLATGGNTSQAMAVSALLSIYLRAAVAATAAEAEIFLSPMTARSRIREVIHGMTAARQFGSMSVGSQTLLFVEGSLPENLPVEEPATPERAMAEPARRGERPPRPPFRKEPRKEFRQGFQERRGPSGRPDTRRPGPPRFQKARPDERGGAKPWQKRRPFVRRDGTREEPRPAAQAGDEKRRESRPWERRERRPGDRGPTGAKPWQRREGSGANGRSEDRRENRGRFDRETGERRPRTEGEPRGARAFERKSEQKPGPGSGPKFGPKFGQKSGPRSVGQKFGPKFGQKSGPKFGQKFGPKFGEKSGEKFGQKFGQKSGPRSVGQKFGEKSGGKFGRKPGGKPGYRSFGAKKSGGDKPEGKPFEKRFGGARGKFAPRREEGGASAAGRGPAGDRRPRLGKPQRREDSGRPPGRGKNFKGQGGKNFRKAGPGNRNPRKNRKQEENPE